jgi:GMP synthase (glutamine-hydrolysing)
MLRFLVVEGNMRAAREGFREAYGLTPSEAYADVLQHLAPDTLCDIAFPADAGANLPDGDGLEGYDGVVLTGSGLNVYDGGPAIERQIELMRAVYKSKTPAFGSCWGIQIGAVAAGGAVTKNERGREINIARNIAPTEAGLSHPLLQGRARAYDAPCSHLDHVTGLPGEITLLASNAMSEVQAAEIRHEGGVFWGVQYHPEFDLRIMAVILERYGDGLILEGFFKDRADCDRFATDMRTLHDEPGRMDVAFRLGIGADILDPAIRRTELTNFIAHQVRPTKSARGRA